MAVRDLTPEIAGLPGFARHVAEAPERPQEAVARAVGRLRPGGAGLEAYFHRLLMTLGGWSQYARYRLWEAELSDGTDTTLADLLAIRLVWEEALFEQHGEAIAEAWAAAQAAYAAADRPTPDLVVDTILQEAAELADQRALAATLDAPAPAKAQARPAVHAAFCIDVRSERFRRALEAVDPRITTAGFAGFFGVAAEHRGFASDVGERRLPVLLSPAVGSRAGGPQDAAADQASRFGRRARRAWGRFKLAAVSSFAFVEASGPLYAGKLLRGALGLEGAAAPDEPAPRLDPELALEARVEMAGKILRAMSLTSAFARVVVLAGHGAGLVNNPHASALQCGACGGHSGEVNARLLAALLNDPEVRRGLTSGSFRSPASSRAFTSPEWPPQAPHCSALACGLLTTPAPWPASSTSAREIHGQRHGPQDLPAIATRASRASAGSSRGAGSSGAAARSRPSASRSSLPA